ncbi:MAG TPA: Uma2 family endonuclease [Planctomycetaceae bacterium]|nr:Uma2 family endonuclease [Planctomycetaceae bacterium]
MNAASVYTAERFAAERFDLPEAGRWFELVAGDLVQFQPPDVAHGNTVLNFSKALGTHFQQASHEDVGYACFELGLLVARDPDTIRIPPVSYFLAQDRDRFARTDEAYTTTPPSLVVEIASTNDRRRNIGPRVTEYLDWGVEHVWVADPPARRMHVYHRGGPSRQLAEHETLVGHPVLPGFRLKVAEVFAEPAWWRGGKREQGRP